MYNNRLENNFVSGQDAEVIKRTRSERQSYEELAKEFREKLKSTISTSELEKLSKGTNASLKTIQSAILVQGTYMKQIAGSLKNIENMQKKILQASTPSFKAPTMKKVTDKDRLDIIGKSKGFTDFNKSVSDFGSSLNKLIEAQKSNNNEVLAALGMVPKNTSDIITKAFGKFLLDNPRMVMLFKFLDRTIGTGARWIFDLGKELGQFNGGFFHKVFGLLSLRQRGAWTNEINYNPAMPLQSIMSTLNAIHKNVWIMNHDESAGGKKKSSELYMEKGGLKAFLDQIPAHYKRIAAAFLGISAAYWPSATAQIGLWLPKIAARTVAGIFTNKAVWGAFTTFLRSPLLSLTVASSLNTAWESIFTRNRERRDERERERRARETTGNTRRFVAGRNSIDNDAWFDNHDRSRGYGAYILEEIRNGYSKFWERGISKTVGNIWDAMFNQSALRAKRNEAEDKDREKYYNDIRYKFLDMINEPGYRANIEYAIENIRQIGHIGNILAGINNRVVPEMLDIDDNRLLPMRNTIELLSMAITGEYSNGTSYQTSKRSTRYNGHNILTDVHNIADRLIDRTRNAGYPELIENHVGLISGALYDGNGDSWLSDIQTSLDTLDTVVTNPIVAAINNISGVNGNSGNPAGITLGDIDSLLYGRNAAMSGSGNNSPTSGGDSIFDSIGITNRLLSFILRELRGRRRRGLRTLRTSIDDFDRNVNSATPSQELRNLLEQADEFHDAIIGPNGEKIADPFGKANDSSSGSKRSLPPVLVQEDGRGGVDLSIFDRGDNIVAVQNGSPMSQAIYALRNMSPEQLKRVIESVGGFASNVLTIKGHPVLGGMMNAATMTGSGLVSAHQFINSDYKSLYEHEDAFGNKYESQSLLTADMTTVMGNLVKAIGKGGQAAIKGLFGGIKAPFSFVKSLISNGGSFKKNFAKGLSNIAKFLESKATWDNIKEFFSLSRIIKGSYTYFIKKPYQLISTALSKSIDFVSDKISAIGQKISGSVIDAFIKDKVKNTAMLGGFGIMGALPVLLQNFGGDFGKGVNAFLNSDVGNLITVLLETFGGKMSGFFSALRMGGEFNDIIEDYKKNGFDMKQLGDASWVTSKAILGSLASIVFGPQAMGIVSGGMDLIKDGLNWMYSDAMNKLTEQWGEFMNQWNQNGLFGGNTVKDGVKAAFQTLALPFGQTAMNVVGDWVEGVNDWMEEKIEGALNWWDKTEKWFSDTIDGLVQNLGIMASDILDALPKALGIKNNLKYIKVAKTLGISTNEAQDKNLIREYETFYERGDRASKANFLNRIGREKNIAYALIGNNAKVLKDSSLKGLVTGAEESYENILYNRKNAFLNRDEVVWTEDVKKAVYGHKDDEEYIKRIYKLNVEGEKELTQWFIADEFCKISGLDPKKFIKYFLSRRKIDGILSLVKIFNSNDDNLKKNYVASIMKSLIRNGEINKYLNDGVDLKTTIAYCIDKSGPEFASLARYVQNNDVEYSQAMALKDYKSENLDIKDINKLIYGSKLDAAGIKYDSVDQRNYILNNKFDLSNISDENLRYKIDHLKGEFYVKRIDKLKGSKKQFIEGFKALIYSKGFRTVLAEKVLLGGAKGLEEFKEYIRKGIVDAAQRSGYDLQGDDAKTLESAINKILDDITVSIAKLAGAKDPESYRGFVQAKWDKGCGYIVNLNNDLVQKFKSFSFSDLYDKISTEVKQMDFKSPIMKANSFVLDKISPYLQTAKTKLSEGADAFKGFISNLFGQMGLSDIFSGLSGLIPSLSGLFGNSSGTASSGGFLGGLFGGGEGSIKNSPEARAFAQQAADFTNTDKFRQKIKARYGAKKYDKWIANKQKGYCARGLKEVLREQGVLTNSEADNGYDAHEMNKLFDGHDGFQNVTDIVKKNNINPASLPPGYVVIMDKSSDHENGHVFMTMGGGMELSDHVQKMNPDYRKSSYGGIKRVYAVKKAGYGGDITSIENDLAQSGAMPSASSSASAGASAPTAIPSSPYTTGVATVLPNETPDTVSDETQKKIAGGMDIVVDKLNDLVLELKSIRNKDFGNTVIAPDNSTVVNNSSTVNSSNNVDNSGAANNSDRYAGMRDYQNMGFQFASSILQ